MKTTTTAILVATLFTTLLICGMQAEPAPDVGIHMAAFQGNVAAIQQHIAAGSDLDAKDAYGSTPLIIAVTFDKPVVVAALVDAGVDLEITNSSGSTSLHTATFFGRIEIVRILLAAGADKYARNFSGSTAFDIAASSFEADLDMYDSLTSALSPMGFTLDYDLVRVARPAIAELLRPTAAELATIDFTPLPGADWPVSTPGEQGLDPTLVAELYLDASRLETIYGLLVVKHGVLIAEEYYNSGSLEQQALLQSATKSYYSALVGLALEQGCLTSLDQKMMDFFPEYVDQISDPRKSQITIRQMLQMRTGYPWEESDPDLWARFIEGDQLPLLADMPLVCDPGTEFHYSNTTTYLLGVIVERACGVELGLFATEHLFTPLDTMVGDWWADSLGYKYPIIHVTARDAAKFGQAYLSSGVYNGTQVLPADWVHDSLTNYSENALAAEPKMEKNGRYFDDCGYGYQWWSATVDGYRFNYAAGHGGQLIVLLDESDMVIVVTAAPYFLQHDAESWKHEQANINLVGKFIKSLLAQ